MLPDFVVIGAMKAGTTSLAAYLGAHPDIFVTDPKEPRFFTHEWDRGLDWYESLFEGSEGAKARGEASTDYTKAPQVVGAADRMAAVVPDVKLVYLVRNPVERIRSQYVHRAARFNESKIERASIDVTVRSKPIYLDWSRYAFQLEPYLERFGRDQLLVVASEHLRTERRETLAGIFEFLGVDPSAEIPTIHEERNRAAGKRRRPRALGPVQAFLWWSGILRRLSPERRKRLQRLLQREAIETEMTPELEAWIWRELEPDLRRLREIVGPDFPLWGRAV